MLRQCPDGSARLSLLRFLVPKLLVEQRCHSCNVRLKVSGPFHWGMEVADLFIAYAIYRLIQGDLAQTLAALGVAILCGVLEYRFCRIEVAGR